MRRVFPVLGSSPLSSQRRDIVTTASCVLVSGLLEQLELQPHVGLALVAPGPAVNLLARHVQGAFGRGASILLGGEAHGLVLVVVDVEVHRCAALKGPLHLRARFEPVAHLSELGRRYGQLVLVAPVRVPGDLDEFGFRPRCGNDQRCGGEEVERTALGVHGGGLGVVGGEGGVVGGASSCMWWPWRCRHSSQPAKEHTATAPTRARSSTTASSS
mmetsp:Transcript_61800/g.146183  ORF Transcript_61800/g.146183 Transcript_61800/m.146183 type:complete len:215 (-) Transcript_61800:248-892(-)